MCPLDSRSLARGLVKGGMMELPEKWAGVVLLLVIISQHKEEEVL